MKKSAKQKLSPGRHQAKYQAQVSTTDYIWNTLHENSKKNVQFWRDFMKMAWMCYSKTCVNFGRCFGNQGWAGAVENIFLFWKWVQLKCRKGSSPYLKGFLRNLRKCTWGDRVKKKNTGYPWLPQQYLIMCWNPIDNWVLLPRKHICETKLAWSR